MLIVVTYILPYLYKLYVIKIRSKNDTPDERAKAREHYIKLKEMEYKHEEHMKAMEIQEQSISGENRVNNFSNDTDKYE